MKRKKKRQPYGGGGWAGTPHHPAPPGPGQARIKALVRLDTQAIRHKSLKDYRKAEQSLEQIKSQITARRASGRTRRSP